MSTTPTTTSAKPRIRVLGPARYLVESSSRPGLGHQVDVLRLRCGCEAGRHGRRCRHLVLAIQYDDWRRRQQAQAAATGKRPSGPQGRAEASASERSASALAKRPRATERERGGAPEGRRSAGITALQEAF